MLGFTRSVTFTAILATWLLLSLPLVIQDSQAAQQERTCEVYEPNMPKGVIEIKKINNLQSPSFPKGFEVEVKNISDKPIYLIKFFAGASDETGGFKMGFHLMYGRRELFEPDHRAEERDIPLLPGESCFIQSDWQDRLPIFKDNDAEYARATNRISLVFALLSFGDGTGYSTRYPYPHKK